MDVTNIPSTELKVIVVWKQHPVLLVRINVSSAGGSFDIDGVYLTFRELIDIILIQSEHPGNGKRTMPKLCVKERSIITIK